ncbi:MAG: Dabb family protein [Ilumatobacteraceae bacterium]
MIRHVVVFRWNDGVEEAHVAATSAAFAELPAQIPQIVSYAFGPDLGVAPANFDYAVTADFESVDDFAAYRDHPAHQALLAAYLVPFIEQRHAVQFTVG